MKFKKVFLDPGHGGRDSGAYNGTIKIKESTVALKVCKRLNKLLKKDGRKTKFSRKIDKTVDLNSRWRKANSWGADLSLCVHCNSSPDKTVRGCEVFHYGSNDRELAKAISSTVSKKLEIFNRGKKEYGWAMTRYPSMPAVLIEIDFISNDVFAKNCKKKEYINKIAKAIYEGMKSVE